MRERGFWLAKNCVAFLVFPFPHEEGGSLCAAVRFPELSQFENQML
jgi:hypothetical protein